MEYSKNWLTEQEYQNMKKAPSVKEEEGGYKYKVQKQKWRDELLIKIMYQAGLQVSETLQLQYPFNFVSEDGEGYIDLNPGGEEEVIKPAGRELVRDVSNFMTAFMDDMESNYVFNIHRSTAYTTINELSNYVDIDKKVGNHTIRRSRARHLLHSEKMDISEVSNFLGHKRISTTIKYLGLSDKEVAKRVNNIDEVEV